MKIPLETKALDIILWGHESGNRIYYEIGRSQFVRNKKTASNPAIDERGISNLKMATCLGTTQESDVDGLLRYILTAGTLFPIMKGPEERKADRCDRCPLRVHSRACQCSHADIGGFVYP